MPRDGDGTFRTELFQRYQRSEKVPLLPLLEMVVNGVSARKARRILDELSGREFSRSTISELAKGLDQQVGAWNERPPEEELPLPDAGCGALQGPPAVSPGPAPEEVVPGVAASGPPERPASPRCFRRAGPGCCRRLRTCNGERSPWLFHHTCAFKKVEPGDRIGNMKRAVREPAERAERADDWRKHDLRHRRVTT